MGLANQVRFKTIGQDTFNYGNKSFQGHFMDQTLEATKSSRSHKDSGILQDQPDSDSDDVKIYTGVRASKKADMFVQKSHPFRPCPVGQVYYDMPPSIGPNSHDLYFSPRKAATGKVEEPIHAQQEPAKRLGSVHHKAAVFPTVASQQERFNLIAQMKQALINATMTEASTRFPLILALFVTQITHGLTILHTDAVQVTTDVSLDGSRIATKSVKCSECLPSTRIPCDPGRTQFTIYSHPPTTQVEEISSLDKQAACC